MFGKRRGENADKRSNRVIGFKDNIEDYLHLRSSLAMMGSGEKIRSILLTAPMHEEGTTSLAVNLAKIEAMSSGRKVVLVDANLKSPSVAEALGFAPEPGLREVLAGEVPLEQAVQESETAGLYVVTAGRVEGAPIEIVSTAGLRKTLDALTRDFGLVLIDSPPVTVYADTLYIAAAADGVLLVIRAESTGRDVARYSIKRLRLAEANILGTVLNRRKRVIPEFIYRRL